jgi:hypothetical protein
MLSRTTLPPSLIPSLSLIPSTSQILDFLSIGIPHATSFCADEEACPQSKFPPPHHLTSLPTLPIPIRILNCYLEDVLQIRVGEDERASIVGIATSSFSDGGTMYFCVHLSTGASLTINSGFVQIIEQNRSELDTSEEERDYHIYEEQEHEQFGRPSSCADPISSSSEEEDLWPEELLHALRNHLQQEIGHEESNIVDAHKEIRFLRERLGVLDGSMMGADEGEDGEVAKAASSLFTGVDGSPTSPNPRSVPSPAATVRQRGLSRACGVARGIGRESGQGGQVGRAALALAAALPTGGHGHSSGHWPGHPSSSPKGVVPTSAPVPQTLPAGSTVDTASLEETFLHNIEVDVCPAFPQVSNETSSSDGDSAFSDNSGSDDMVGGGDATNGIDGVAGGQENEEGDLENMRFAYQASTW